MTFPSIRIEGTILSGELLAKLDSADSLGQRPADFGFDSQGKLKDEIVRAWTSAQAFYTAFQHKLASVKEGAPATTETRNQWIIPLLGLLGYAELEFQSQSENVGDKPFRLSHRLRSHGGFAVHIVGARESLDKKPATGPRVSPHAHLQEYLNLTEHLYGIVTNGRLLRLLRDSTRLIKLSYVEFDLDRMFSEELFADFAVLYRLLHATRLPKLPEKSAESLLERYHQDALESGARIRDGLSVAVEQVLQELGSGFLAQNESLQAAVANNSLAARELHHGLLRLIYRLLLMMVAEERGLLFAEAATPRQRKLYADYYSIARLRRIAERRALADSTKHDLWRGLRSTFRLFETDGPGAPLGLTGLGGQLFSASALGPLQAAELDNGTLLSALAKLSLFRQPDTSQLSRVNYGALATEEFGSVYERLLELHPVVNPAVGNLPPTFTFKQAAGNERKTSGSYYTPSSLVECLLDSALDPVLEDRLKNFAKLGYKSADEAVLALKVCDPACGSGHFLIAAAQRIARRLALLRSKGDEPSVSELRHTLREVISHCIYGVDINPMSVELCKVGLWLEAMEAGKPLSFLDHHIRCGNSLLGATPALIAEGIPDDAFTAIEGDDKKACAALKKLNARERRGFGELFVLEDSATSQRLQQAAVAVENLPDDSVRAVEQKSAAFEQLQHNYDFEKATDLANLWCAAFVIRKRMADGERIVAPAAPLAATDAKPAPTQTGLFGESFQQPAGKSKSPAKTTGQPSSLAEAIGITSGHLRDFAKGAALPDGLVKEVHELAGEYNFFHWHLEFPDVFVRGGFDVILGNPPWVRQELLKPVKPLLVVFNSFASTADSSVYFLERATETTRPGGRVAMLTPNKWFRAAYAEQLRRILRERCRFHLLVDFGHSRTLFPGVDTFPASVTFEVVASQAPDNESAQFVRAHDSDREQHSLNELIHKHPIRVIHANLRPERWQLEDSAASELLTRLLSTGQPLESLLNRTLLSGIKTGFNEAFYLDSSLHDKLVAEDQNSEIVFKKFLRGRDVKRWRPQWDGQWHIVIPSSLNRDWPWSKAQNEFEAESEFAATFPAVHAHLKQFEKPLRERQDKGKYWWELRACDYYHDFERPKFIVQCIAYYSQFAFDSCGHYVNNKAIVIPAENLYLLAILNSRVTWWIVNRTFQHMKDEGLSVDVQFLKRLPIPNVSDQLRSEIETLAGDVIAVCDATNGPQRIPTLEIRLNELVTRAFALTDSEQRVLNSSLPPRDPIAEVENMLQSAAASLPHIVIPAPIWMDRPLVPPTSRRVVLAPDRYRATLVPHLLYQSGGSLSFERFRKAYWLLTEPKTLERYATGTIGEIARSWGRTFKDKLEKGRFIEHLKGAVGRQLHFTTKNGERWLELRDPKVADDEHIVFDARLALLVADLWPVDDPIAPLTLVDEIAVQELEAVL
jgi:type I restriction-modification system DNA methylase subunit